MPRVENSGANVTKFCEESGNESSTHDLCKGCADPLHTNPTFYSASLRPFNGDPVGDEGHKLIEEHPSYNEGADYWCEICCVLLNDGDD